MFTAVAIAAALSLSNVGATRETYAPNALESHARNRLTFGPAPLLLGRIALEYERAISDRVSLFAGPQFSATGALGIGARNVSLAVGARLFYVGRAPHGLWIGSELVPAWSESLWLDTQSVRSTTRSLTGLGTLGMTLSLGPLTSSAGVGGGLAVSDERFADGSVHRALVPAVSLHLNTGITF